MHEAAGLPQEATPNPRPCRAGWRPSLLAWRPSLLMFTIPSKIITPELRIAAKALQSAVSTQQNGSVRLERACGSRQPLLEHEMELLPTFIAWQLQAICQRRKQCKKKKDVVKTCHFLLRAEACHICELKNGLRSAPCGMVLSVRGLAAN